MEFCIKARNLVCGGRWNTFTPLLPVLNNQVRHYAARKGTREKAKKKKVKVEIKKIGFIPHKLREKALTTGIVKSRRVQDYFKPLPVDDVWVSKFYQWKVYDFEEAIQCHRETHHPQIYNQPSAPVTAVIELDMRTAKKTKFVDSFSRMSRIQHEYSHGEDRSILVFCKTQELKDQANAAGATLVGDVDIVKKVEKGDVVLPDFQFVLAHPNILPELVSLRGLLKKKFPNPKSGTLGLDIGAMVQTFKTGIYYTAKRDEKELDYGWIEAVIGPLDMETQHLKDNLQSLINDVNSMRPKRDGAFITRVILKCPPSVEKLKLDLKDYLPDGEEKDDYESDSDDDEVQRVATKS